MSELNIEKDFLSNVDYLNALIKKIEKINSSDYDSNLVYEIHYADLYLNSIITQITDTKLIKQVSDIKSAFNIILSEINYDDLDESGLSSAYKNIIKAKYKDIDLGTYTEDVAYNKERPLIFYIKNRIPCIITLIFVRIIVYRLSDIYESVFSMLTGNTTSGVSNFNIFTNLINTFASIFVIIFTITIMLESLLDLIYLAVPYIRYKLGNNWCSEQAKLTVEMMEKDTNIGYKKVRNYNRIRRNKLWLGSMLKMLEPIKSSNEKFAKLYHTLDVLKNDIDTNTNRKHLYYQYAKIEFLHNEFLSLMKECSI